MAVTCGVPGFVPAPGTKPQVNAQCDVSEGRMHPKTNACWPVNSQLGAGRESAGGPVDPVDDDRVRGTAGAHRRDGLLPSHAHAGVGDPQWPRTAPVPAARRAPTASLRLVPPPELGKGSNHSGDDLRRRAWQWALANRTADGNLPSGRVIARAHGRKERWGRLVKNAGQQRVFGSAATSGTSPGGDKMREVAAAGPDGAR